MRLYALLISIIFLLGNVPQLEDPKPEVFQRSQDRERARLSDVPCAKKDLGRGCYSFDGRMIRDAPCSYRIDANTFGSIPTEDCFKMTPPRRYSGIWIDEFEGQQFVPDGSKAAEWPNAPVGSPEWRKQFDRAHAARIWIDASHVKVGRRSGATGRKVRIAFIGRKTMYSGNYGHMGVSGHYIVVDRVLSAKELD